MSGLKKQIWKCEPEALNKILKEFYATVCMKDRHDSWRDTYLRKSTNSQLILREALKVWNKFLRKKPDYFNNKAKVSHQTWG